MGDARPSNVIWFERLMYLAIAIAAVSVVTSTAIDWNRFAAARSRRGIALVFALMSAVIALRWWLVWLAARRAKVWARGVTSFLVGIGIISGINQLGFGPLLIPWDAAFSVVEVILQVAALVLIFTGNARDWFLRTPIRAG